MEFPREECRTFNILEKDVGDINDNSNIMKYCSDNNMVLIRGDVVCVKYDKVKMIKFEHVNYQIKDILYIFNGEVLEKPHYVDPISPNLPRAFCVIENDVPTNYWYNTKFRDFVWFNHNNFTDELLQNVQYGVIDGQYCIYTTFDHNNKQYRIIFDYISRFMIDNDESLVVMLNSNNVKDYDDTFEDDFSFKHKKDQDYYTELFIEILSSGREIAFSAGSDEYDIHDGRTLFVSDYA